MEKFFVFTEEERETLRKILQPLEKKYGEFFAELSDGFMKEVEVNFVWLLELRDMRLKRDHQKLLNKAFASFQEASGYLKQILRYEIRPPLTQNFFDNPDIDTPGVNWDFIIYTMLEKRIYEWARETEPTMKWGVEIFDALSNLSLQGKKKEITAGFTKAVAFSLHRCFQIIPSGYKEGIFARFIYALFAMAGISRIDLRRPITAAVKTIKASIPQ